MISILHYEFFRNALLAAVLSSIACGIIGTYIVTRRLVFISGGITHASFGGIGLAYFLGLSPILGAAIFALLTAIGITFLNKKSGMRQDSAIGMFWSLGMALGILFIFLSSGYTPQLMSYLFGSILTVSLNDLYWMLALVILIIAVFILFFRTILYIAFDENYAKTRQLPVNTINLLLLALVSLSIVLNIRVVGVILVISFLTIPQVTANLFTNDFKTIILYSVPIALLGSIGGLLLSFYIDLPSGPVIICCFVIIFALAKIVRWLCQRIMVRKMVR